MDRDRGKETERSLSRPTHRLVPGRNHPRSTQPSLKLGALIQPHFPPFKDNIFPVDLQPTTNICSGRQACVPISQITLHITCYRSMGMVTGGANDTEPWLYGRTYVFMRAAHLDEFPVQWAPGVGAGGRGVGFLSWIRFQEVRRSPCLRDPNHQIRYLRVHPPPWTNSRNLHIEGTV